MKTNMKLIGSIVLLGVLVMGVNGCKKTETEQLSHYQSANHRILGTWKLKSSSDVETTVTNVTTTNDVNSSTETYSETETVTTTFNGSTYTTSTKMTSNDVSKVVEWDNLGNPQFAQTVTNTTDIVSTIGSTWLGSSSVSIWKDYTYDASQATYENQMFGQQKSVNSNVQTTYNGTLTGISSDSTFENMDQDITTSEGSWWWNDAGHNNLDLAISAGLMGGNIITLSSTKVVIGENDKQNDSETDYTESNIQTFTNNQNAGMTAPGISTTITTTVSNRVYTETWEKTASETMP